MSSIDWKVELERLHGMSFAWAMHCCGQRREEAQDVLQEVYLRVLEGRTTFSGRASAKTWLFSVIRHTALDRNRRQWLRAALIERWLPRETVSNALSGPEQSIENADSNQQLRAALTRLSARQQEVLHLVFYQDLTIDEAACLLGISLGSARTHFDRGKARLRECLQGGTAS